MEVAILSTGAPPPELAPRFGDYGTMFSRLLGVHVQRLATLAHGDGICTTNIPRASGTTHVPHTAPKERALI